MFRRHIEQETGRLVTEDGEQRTDLEAPVGGNVLADKAIARV